MAEVEYVCRDGVAHIRLNRPHRLNAVVPALTEQLIEALTRATKDQAKAVVLAGNGRAFCAGHDLKEPEPVETVEETRQRLEQIQDVTRLIRRFPGVVVAAVHGFALGAGCEFALACDIVVADEGAQFGFPEVSVGLSVTGGISRLLPHLVGLAKAKELLLLGERVPAAEAVRIGLISQVTRAHEKLATEIAEQIAARPRTAVSLAKKALDLGLDSSLEGALATEVEHAILTSLSGEGAAPREEFNRD